MKRLLGASLVAVLTLSAGAWANTVSPTLNFNGAGDNTSSSFSASGKGSMSLSGTIYVKPLGLFWMPVNVNFSGNNLTLGANPDAITWAADPTGSGQIEFERVNQPLDDGKLTDLNVNLKDGAAWNLALDRMELTDSSNGLFRFFLDTTGSINTFSYDMTGAATGTYNSGTRPVVTYDVSPTGTLTAGYNAAMSGSLSIGVSVFGNWIAFDIPLGTIFGGGTVLNLPAGASGTMTLNELAGPFPHDVSVAIDWAIGPVSIPFSATDSFVLDKAKVGNDPYYHLTGQYDFGGLFKIGSTSFSLHDTVGGIVPEPISALVMSVGSLALALRRRGGR